jgi:hypothetical protein
MGGSAGATGVQRRAQNKPSIARLGCLHSHRNYGEDGSKFSGRGPAPVPCLVAASDIQGCFHTHTLYTRRANTIEEMVMAARDCGYRYIGISDHSQSAHYVNGLKEDRIRAQWSEIHAVQRRYHAVQELANVELGVKCHEKGV